MELLIVNVTCEYNEKAMSNLFCLKKTFAMWKYPPEVFILSVPNSIDEWYIYRKGISWSVKQNREISNLNNEIKTLIMIIKIKLAGFRKYDSTD